MKNTINIGDKFGRLTVRNIYSEKYNLKIKIFIQCLCECGNIKKIYKSNLIYGKTKSCGCLQRELIGKKSVKHGLSKDRKFIDAFYSAKKRTLKDINYINKGITFNLISIDIFKEKMYESYLEHIKLHGKDNTSLDRINNNKGYEYGNIRWATRLIQNNNQGLRKDQKPFVININGKEIKYYNKTKCANDIGGKVGFICDCLKRGHTPRKRKDILYIKYI